MRNFFCMISKGDVPLYEVHLSPPPPRAQGKDDLLQFILHASLDSVDAKMWQTTTMFLRNVDRFNDLCISSLITPGRQQRIRPYSAVRRLHPPATFLTPAESTCTLSLSSADIKMLLLHDQRTDEGAIRAFFFDCYDLYVKVSPPQYTASRLSSAV